MNINNIEQFHRDPLICKPEGTCLNGEGEVDPRIDPENIPATFYLIIGAAIAAFYILSPKA